MHPITKDDLEFAAKFANRRAYSLGVSHLKDEFYSEACFGMMIAAQTYTDQGRTWKQFSKNSMNWQILNFYRKFVHRKAGHWVSRVYVSFDDSFHGQVPAYEPDPFVKKVFADLPAHYQQALMAKIDGYGAIQELADDLHKSHDAIFHYATKALKKLRTKLATV